jgi:propanol-preferring alcohol dehydrogenase
MGAEEFIDFTKEKDVPAKIKEIADGIGAHGVLVTAYQAYNGKHRSTAAAVVHDP